MEKNVVEIRGKNILRWWQVIIHRVGNHNTLFSRTIRKLYWKTRKTYLWGIVNYYFDFKD